MGGFRKEIVEDHARVTLYGLLAVRAVEKVVVDVVAGERVFDIRRGLRNPVGLFSERGVGRVEGSNVGDDGDRAVDLGIFRG